MTETTSPKIEHRDSLTIIHLGEEYENLDESALESLRELLLKAVDEADPPKVILDLSHTTFFGSSFIELIFRAWNRAQSRPGGIFVISGLTKYCREVIAITHLDQLWKLYDNVDDAVAALNSDG
jgi:anti-anti-sigma factor